MFDDQLMKGTQYIVRSGMSGPALIGLGYRDLPCVFAFASAASRATEVTQSAVEQTRWLDDLSTNSTASRAEAGGNRGVLCGLTGWGRRSGRAI
jgi:hypothetical protein